MQNGILASSSIARLWRSRYVRNIATLSSGQLINSAVPILCAPILGRLYTPKDYGFLGAYMSVATVLSAIGNWQYSQGIVFDKSEVRARTLISVCLLTSLITSVVSVLVAAAMIYWSHSTERWWYVLLPVTALIGGVSATLIALVNRKGHYERIAAIQLFPTLVTVLTSIGLGFQGAGSTGLMIAYFLGQFITLAIVIRAVKYDINWRTLHAPIKHIVTVATRHRRFPIYTLPSNFISSLTLNSPIYALQGIGAVTDIGLYTRANQLLGMPMSLFGGSVAQVYQRKAAEELKIQGNCWSIYKRTLMMLFVTGFVPCVFLFAFAPQLFRIVLGPKWEAAGQIARILTPMLFLRLICSPLSTTFYVVDAQREDFVLSIVTYTLTLGLVGTAVFYSMTSEFVIGAFSVAYIAIYLIYITRAGFLARR